MGDSNTTVKTTWPYCFKHRQPCTTPDPGSDPYCWEGFRQGEVDDCEPRFVSATFDLSRVTGADRE